jgi:adenylate cyclase
MIGTAKPSNRLAPMTPTGLHGWLEAAGLRGESVVNIVDGLAERLLEGGFPLSRLHVSVSTLHPLIRAYGHTWEKAKGATESADFLHTDGMAARSQTWQESPFRTMLENDMPILRRRLSGPEARLDYPVLEEFAAAGHTDWFAVLTSFGWASARSGEQQLGMIASWSIDASDGLQDAELEGLAQLSRTLALSVKAATAYPITRTLLGTYLGDDAAERVMSGVVQRGDVSEMEAALLYADLRDFTALADRMEGRVLVRMLDDYLDAIGAPVAAAGGEVLKFMGDGLIAVFPVGAGGMPAACRQALRAALGALQANQNLNLRRASVGDPAMSLDVALHCGRVMYGNVGTATRLDFTTVGPAVNEAARLEALCTPLARHLVTSASFCAAAQGSGIALESIGEHMLRGVSRPQEVFTVLGAPRPAA